MYVSIYICIYLYIYVYIYIYVCVYICRKEKEKQKKRGPHNLHHPNLRPLALLQTCQQLVPHPLPLPLPAPAGEGSQEPQLLTVIQVLTVAPIFFRTVPRRAAPWFRVEVLVAEVFVGLATDTTVYLSGRWDARKVNELIYHSRASDPWWRPNARGRLLHR